MSFRVVIPSRYGSTRLAGKALREIAGRPLVAHVLDRAGASGADEVVVATDHELIVGAVEAAGGRAIMTRADHASGTDRLAEVASRLGWGDDDIVVNLQGDEPLVPPALPRRLARALEGNPTADIATLATPIEDANELFRPSVVKVVLDATDHALYFSRAPIPWARDAFANGAPTSLPAGTLFLRHVGLYAYRVRTLRRLGELPSSPAERAESLEQLRALACAVRIHVTIVAEAPGHGVDTQADLDRVREILER